MAVNLPDQNIAAQVNPNQGLNSMASIMNMQNTMQGMQARNLQMQGQQQANQLGAIDVQKAQQANNERVALQSFTQNPENWQTDGHIDMDKINKAVPAIAPYTGSDFIGKMTTLADSQSKAKSAVQNLTQDQRALIAGPLGVLGRAGINDPVAYEKEIDNVVAQNPGNKDLAKLGEAYKTTMGITNPQGLAQHAIIASQELLRPGEQQAQLSPTVSAVNTGAATVPVINQPAVGGNAPSMQVGGGQAIPTQLSPQTQIFNPQTGGMEYLGPQGQQPQQTQQIQPQTGQSTEPNLGKIPPAVQASRDNDRLGILTNELATEKDPMNRAALQREIDRTKQNIQAETQRSQFNTQLNPQLQQQVAQAAPQPQQRLAASAPVGVPGAVQGTQDTINKDWNSRVEGNKSAQQDIGVLQAIKQHAAGAATGVGADRQALMQGIAGKLGISTDELAKTDTDLLAKNANMLALAGGNTDSARALAEMANPNGHMTKEAIVQAANQIIAQKNMNVKVQNYLAPFKQLADQGHPESYNQALGIINQVADPRLLQLQDMSPADMAKMKASMTPAEQQAFGQKIRKAKELGIM